MGREGRPSRVHAGANVCVQEEGGWCRHAGNTGPGIGMSGFSLPRGSPMTLELNLPEPQFSQLPNGDAENLLHRVVKKIQTNGCEWSPRTKHEGCSGVGCGEELCRAPGLSQDWGYQAVLGLG